MKFSKIFSITLVMLLAIVGVSCKKDKDKFPRLKNLSGNLTFSVPAFTSPKQTINVTASGVSNNDGLDINYTWSVPQLKIVLQASTNPDFSFQIPDTLGTISVICSASVPGYNTIRKFSNIEIINKEKSLVTDGNIKSNNKFIDTRDNNVYYYKKIGNREWFLNNLAYKGPNSVSYSNSSLFDPIMGMFYNRESALASVPTEGGWRIPTKADWDDLMQNIGTKNKDGKYSVAGAMIANATFNGISMWPFSPNVAITNASGFSALPFGFANKSDNGYLFNGFGYYACFMADELSPDGKSNMIYYLNFDTSFLLNDNFSASGLYASVRCVRDLQESAQ